MRCSIDKMLHVLRRSLRLGFALMWLGLPTLQAQTPTPAQLTYRITGKTADGFLGEIRIRNTGTSAIEGWKLVYADSNAVHHVWNAAFSVQPDSLVLQNGAWNPVIAPDSTIHIRFSAGYSGRIRFPQSARLNGILLSWNSAPSDAPFVPSDTLRLSATYRLKTQWTDGYNAEIRLKNTGKSTIEGWEVTLPASPAIQRLWQGAWTHTDTTNIIRHLDWNRSIAAQDSVQFGFSGTFTDALTLPDSITVNGHRVKLRFENTPKTPAGIIRLHLPPAPIPDVAAFFPLVRIRGNGFDVALELPWNEVRMLPELPLGDYTIEWDGMGEPDVFFLPASPPVTLTLTDDAPTADLPLVWGTPQYYGALVLSLPRAPHPDAPVPLWTFAQGEEILAQERLPWGTSWLRKGLPSGTSYQIWGRAVGVDDTLYVPEFTASNQFSFQALVKGITRLDVTYSATPFTPQNPVSVPVTIEGLPSDTLSVALRFAAPDHVFHQTLKPGYHGDFQLPEATYQFQSARVTAGLFEYAAFMPPETITADALTPETRLSFRIYDSVWGRFAPFVDASAWPLPKLDEMAQKGGMDRFVLGFIVNDQTKACTPKWGGYTVYSATQAQENAGEGMLHLRNTIAELRKRGGNVMVSFGGANGKPLEASCTDVSSLATAIQGVLDAYQLSEVDFDVEGAWVSDSASIQRRAEALTQLQRANPHLKIWLTLPVTPSGLDLNAQNVLRALVQAGVAVLGVNIMAMNYGAGAAPDPELLDQYAIQALKNVHSDIQNVYQSTNRVKSAEEVWRMLGITPMIGVNDLVREVFTTAYADTLLHFAQKQQIGLLSMWSVQRDFACGTEPVLDHVSPTCSGLVQEDYTFSKRFSGFNQSSRQSIPTNTDAPASLMPEAFALEPNFPNPFRTETTFRFRTGKDRTARIRVFDLLGRVVLPEQTVQWSAGTHEFRILANGLPSGVYLCVVESENQSVRRQMVIVR